MLEKIIQFKTKGMTKDLSESIFNPEFSFENYNIRLSTLEHNTLFSAVNERGTLDLETTILGTPIGYTIVDDKIILFTAHTIGLENISRIYLIDITDEIDVLLICSADLGFSEEHPIEALSVYENSNAIKIYWVDGINLPRVLNLANYYKNPEYYMNNNNTQFNFIPNIGSKGNATITRHNSSIGTFTSGVILYAFTYYNLFGSESNIFFTSPLNYISHVDRGGSPEDSIANSFEIKLDNLDNRFDYVRIYSIHRTNQDAIPTVKRVADISIQDSAIIETSEHHLALHPGYRIDDVDTETKIESISCSETLGSILYNGTEAMRHVALTSNYVLIGDVRYYSSEDKKAIITWHIEIYFDGDEINHVMLKSPGGIWIFHQNENNERTASFTDYGTSGEIVEPSLLLYIGGKEIIAHTMALKSNTLFLGNIEAKNFIVPDYIKNALKTKFNDFVFLANKEVTEPTNTGVYPYTNKLDKGHRHTSTFMYDEWYRFGVQLLSYTGEWSLPIFLGDKQNTILVDTNNLVTKLITGNLTISDTDLIELLKQYKAIRPVVVYPTYADRNVLCLGVVAPTVFNKKDRTENAPFAQSSWFFRADCNISTTLKLIHENGAVATDLKAMEYRHYWSLPSNKFITSEILSNVNNYNPSSINSDSLEDDTYFVDLSIITLHSPDIEFDTNLHSLTSTSMKIVGYVPITGVASDIDILTSTPPLNYRKNADSYPKVAPGFVKENINEPNITLKPLGLITVNAWLDEIYCSEDHHYNNNLTPWWFPVYPWHRNGSLNNQSYNKIEDGKDTGHRNSRLKTKKMSNLRFSFNTKYISNTREYALNDLLLFDSLNPVNVRLVGPFGNKINYYGNVDKLITHLDTGYTIGSETYYGYKLAIAKVPSSYQGNLIPMEGTLVINNNIFDFIINTDSPTTLKDVISVDPILIKYKSTIHAVLSLAAIKENDIFTQKVLPRFNGTRDSISFNVAKEAFWDKTKIKVSLDAILITGEGTYPSMLWLVNIERGKDNFGSLSDEALQSNLWLPCGDAKDISNNIKLVWNEGDSFYQRYDCLKTYPYTMEDTNSIVEILSFMCETRINLDGRYDRNRGLTNNLTMTPANFNQMNLVYSQLNNFFNSRILDKNLFNVDKYPYTITWTKNKINGDKVDTWTNITMTSILDLDGDKGEITSLNKLDDSIIAFLPKGISLILYDEQTLITTTDGVPIEIASSRKVLGKRYLSSNQGCLNKWSICTTPVGIYFKDDYNKTLNLFDGKTINKISDLYGFHSWMSDKCSTDVWNPKDFNNIVTYYDLANQDVYFISKDYCLTYSEGLGRFSSFYSYENSPYFINLKGEGYWLRNLVGTTLLGTNFDKLLDNQINFDIIKFIEKDDNGCDKFKFNKISNNELIRPYALSDVCLPRATVIEDAIDYLIDEVRFVPLYCTLWKHNKGDYNKFFGKLKSFYTTIVVNPEPTIDKIFSTIDLVADSFNGEECQHTIYPFNKIEVWNEHQHGINVYSLNSPLHRDMRKKFRIWRADIPRNNLSTTYKRDRIRNPWMYLKISNELNNTLRTVLHDMTIHYFS